MAGCQVSAVKIVNVGKLRVLGDQGGEVRFSDLRFLSGQIPKRLAGHGHNVALVFRNVRRQHRHAQRWQAGGKHHLGVTMNLARNMH